MTYVFDTDVLSSTVGARPNRSVDARIRQTPWDAQFTTTISLGEMLYGAIRRNRLDLQAQIETIFRRMRVLPFDDPAARVFASVKAELERQGTPLDEPDLRIAAITLSGGLILVTGNVRHFSRISGLRIENWLASP